MHKSISYFLIVLSAMAFLLGGCSNSSDETSAAPVVIDTAETTEVTDVVEIVETGACTVRPPAQPMACTMQYDPVCGCDGKTYGNACSARGAGVSSSTPGACKMDPVD